MPKPGIAAGGLGICSGIGQSTNVYRCRVNDAIREVRVGPKLCAIEGTQGVQKFLSARGLAHVELVEAETPYL